MPREAVQGEEEAPARMWGQSTFKGCAEEEGGSTMATERVQLWIGNQGSSDSEGKGGGSLEVQGGLQGQLSQENVLWDWQLGVGG